MKTWLKRLFLLGVVLAFLVLAALEALRFTASKRGVVAVPLPEASEIIVLGAGANYSDAYRGPLRRASLSAAEIASVAIQQGREIARTDNEVVFEGKAPGLRFLVSYIFELGPTGGHVTIATAVFYDSLLGRLYFAPVGVGHRRLVPFALSRELTRLEEAEPDSRD